MNFHPPQLAAEGAYVAIGSDPDSNEVLIVPFTGDISLSPVLSVLDNTVIPSTATTVGFTGYLALVEISLTTSVLTDLAGLSAINLTDVTITAGGGGAPPLYQVVITGAALNVATVDHLIAACVAGAETGGFLTLTGGTSAAPSGASTANLATLSSRGWTVATN